MMRVILIAVLLSLSSCASKSAYVADCEKATFTGAQCQFLYSKRDIRFGVNGPLIGGIVGINLP